MENTKLIQFKINLRNHLLSIYKKQGYSYTQRTIEHLIKNSNKKSKEVGYKDLPINIRGECCEILLEIQILEFAKQNNLPWFLSKGLSFYRRDYKKEKITELDLTLFTPARVVLFESKYRQGKVTLIDKCTIVPSYGNVTDVYKQNIMHLDNLRYYLNEALIDIKRGKPFSLALYMNDLKNVTDNRNEAEKKILPLLGTDNIIGYLKRLSEKKNIVWDIKKLHTIITDLDSKSDMLFEEHLKEVRKT